MSGPGAVRSTQSCRGAIVFLWTNPVLGPATGMGLVLSGADRANPLAFVLVEGSTLEGEAYVRLLSEIRRLVQSKVLFQPVRDCTDADKTQ